MIFTVVRDPVPYVIIDNLYTEQELKLIYRELNQTFSELQPPEFTCSAATHNGDMLKHNKGVFLDNLYENREFSDILRLNRKLFSSEVAESIAECNYGFKFIKHSTLDSSLISYYENGDFYKPHFDMCVITAVTWFHTLPKNFSGGDFIFTDYDISIEAINNRCVIFFSFTTHAVTPVTLIDQSIPGSGRFSLTQFLGI
jgi:hypothetical protein